MLDLDSTFKKDVKFETIEVDEEMDLVPEWHLRPPDHLDMEDMDPDELAMVLDWYLVRISKIDNAIVHVIGILLGKLETGERYKRLGWHRFGDYLLERFGMKWRTARQLVNLARRLGRTTES